MGDKYNKPLIIITAALSIAVITLSVQVVLLTFTVKDNKDIVKQLQARTNSAYTVENRYTELNGTLQHMRREVEALRNDTLSFSSEVSSLREVISKLNTDNHFLLLELNDISKRITKLEKRQLTTSATASSVIEMIEQKPNKAQASKQHKASPSVAQNSQQVATQNNAQKPQEVSVTQEQKANEQESVATNENSQQSSPATPAAQENVSTQPTQVQPTDTTTSTPNPQS